MILFSLYHLIGGKYNSIILPLILAVIMSAILLKKSSDSQKAIEKNDYYTIKTVFRKTLVLAAIFLVVYVLWTTAIFRNIHTAKTISKIDTDFANKGLIGIETVNLKIDKLDYVRIGAPAAKFGNKFDRKTDKDLDLKPKEDQFEKELKEKYSVFYNLPKELPLYAVFVFFFTFILIKFGLFFTHFRNYKDALEKQEK
mmetsp:Transcript_14245/g.15926  ORF Transcript_14245/g.15926 Transcript_14245/m.15926 type:complete len:198 (-) Transcript_14245:243-836(-)